MKNNQPPIPQLKTPYDIPSMNLAKRVIFVIGGILWFLFAVGFGVILARYISHGAGSQFLGGPVSSGSVLMGLAHVIGLVTVIIICFAIGTALCVRGLLSKPETAEKTEHPADTEPLCPDP